MIDSCKCLFSFKLCLLCSLLLKRAQHVVETKKDFHVRSHAARRLGANLEKETKKKKKKEREEKRFDYFDLLNVLHPLGHFELVLRHQEVVAVARRNHKRILAPLEQRKD